MNCSVHRQNKSEKKMKCVAKTTTTMRDAETKKGGIDSDESHKSRCGRSNSTPCQDIHGNGTSSSSPTSSSRSNRARLRLLKAKRLDASIVQAKTGSSSSSMDTPRRSGEQSLLRFGKKLDEKYVLITVYYRKPRLRFVVYVAEDCARHVLVCTHREVEEAEEEDENEEDEKVSAEFLKRHKTLIERIASEIYFDRDGKIAFSESVPATWVTE